MTFDHCAQQPPGQLIDALPAVTARLTVRDPAHSGPPPARLRTYGTESFLVLFRGRAGRSAPVKSDDVMGCVATVR